MRKLIAILLSLSMVLCLLAGCGGNEAPVSSAAPVESITEEASVSVEESVIVEEPSIHEDGGPMDSVELAKWVWEKADAASESHYAEDYDISMTVETDVAGEYTYTQSSIRSKEITSDNGAVVYTKTTSDGETSEVWYGDGAYYQSSSLGNFKVPMTFEEYEAREEDDATENPLANIEPEQFGKLFATRMSNGYGVNFSQPTLDTWMAVADMFTSEDQESYTCEAFDLEGYMQCDEAGNVTQVKLDMTVTLDMMGIPITMVITANQLTMGYDEKVTIELPDADESFIELPDLSIPTALLANQLVTKAQPALRYQEVWALTIDEPAGVSSAMTTLDIAYNTDESGLTGHWIVDAYANGELTDYLYESYAGGEITSTTAEGETTEPYSDEDFLYSVQTRIFSYSETFNHGFDFETYEENGAAVLSYSLNQEYVESLLLQDATDCGVDYLITDGTITDSYGSYTLWMDSSGILLSQMLDLTVAVTYEDTPITLNLQIGGDIIAIGSDVIIE